MIKCTTPPTLRLASTAPQPPIDPSPALPYSSEQKDPVPSPTSSKGKEMTKELPPPNVVVDVEGEEEVVEGVLLKRKKKDKKQEKKGAKEKELKA